MAVVSQGKKIMDIVSQAVQQLQAGNSSEAIALLEQIQGDAKILCDETQYLIEQLKALKDYYKNEVQVIES